MTVATALAVFASLLFSLFVIGFGSRQKLQAIEWDMSTVTVADYSVEFAITPEAYMKWYDEIYKESGDADNGVPQGVSLKKHLKDAFEKHLTDDRLSEKGIDTNAKNKKKLLRLNNMDEVKIADIVFGYANQKLIEALTSRGTYIGKNKFKKMEKEDHKVRDLVKEDFDSLIRPTAAFVIFEEEEGAAQALKSVSGDR